MSFFRGSDGPRTPSYAEEIGQTRRQAGIAYDRSDEQQEWARRQWANQQTQMALAQQQQNQASGDLYRWGREDREMYDQYGRPLVQQMMQDAADWNDPNQQNLEAAGYQASAQQAFDAQRENAQRNLESYGIDPSQTRSQALDLEARVNNAAQVAASGNVGRRVAKQTGLQLRDAAIGAGLNSAQNATQQYGAGTNTGSNTVNTVNSTVGTGANTMGTGMGWQAQGIGATGQVANMKTQDFNNKVASKGAEGQSGFGQLLGFGSALAGGYIAGKQDGGEVREGEYTPPGPEDTVPTMLAEGEYVIPREVVERKGTEFFDRMKDKVMAEVEEKRGNNAPPVVTPQGVPVQGFQAGGPVSAPTLQPYGQQAIPYQQDVQLVSPSQPQQQSQSQPSPQVAGQIGAMMAKPTPAPMTSPAPMMSPAPVTDLATGAVMSPTPAAPATEAGMSAGAKAFLPIAAWGANEIAGNKAGRRGDGSLKDHAAHLASGKGMTKDITAGVEKLSGKDLDNSATGRAGKSIIQLATAPFDPTQLAKGGENLGKSVMDMGDKAGDSISKLFSNIA